MWHTDDEERKIELEQLDDCPKTGNYWENEDCDKCRFSDCDIWRHKLEAEEVNYGRSSGAV